MRVALVIIAVLAPVLLALLAISLHVVTIDTYHGLGFSVGSDTTYASVFMPTGHLLPSFGISYQSGQ